MKGQDWVTAAWQIVIVLTAVAAIITNLIVVGELDKVNDDVVQLSKDVVELEYRHQSLTNRMDVDETLLVEMQAQVRWGLAEKYEVKE